MTGGSDIIIRDVRPDDVEEIGRIAVAAWEPVFRYFREAMGDELFTKARGDWRKDKATQVTSACQPGSPQIVYVAEHSESDRLAGFVTFRVDETRKTGEIGNNAVHPDFQGRGIATRLYGRALERMKELGCVVAKVGTGGDDSHAPARRAYRKAGFEVEIPHVTYWREL